VMDSMDTFFRKVSTEIGRACPDLGNELPPPDREGFSDLTAELAERDKKLILFLDDFDLALRSEMFPEDFFTFLRGKANTQKVAYVTATAERMMTLFARRSEVGSPFFNVFSVMPLGPMERDDVTAIVETPVGSTPGLLAGHGRTVYHLAGGFPLLVQCLCQILHTRRRRGVRLDDEDIDEAAEAVVRACRYYLHNCWQRLSRDERNMAKRLLQGGSVVGLEERLGTLNEKGYIYIDEKTDRPILFPGLFRRFAREKLGMDDEDTVLDKSFFEWLRKISR